MKLQASKTPYLDSLSERTRDASSERMARLDQAAAEDASRVAMKGIRGKGADWIPVACFDRWLANCGKYLNWSDADSLRETWIFSYESTVRGEF